MVRSAVTDVEGKYLIYDLAPDTYRVGFSNSEALYHSAFFGEDAYYISHAQDIVIESGTRIDNIGAQLAGITLNVPPLAAEDEIIVQQAGQSSVLAGGLSHSVLTNDQDAENATLTAILVTPPNHGTLALNPDGTFMYLHDGSVVQNDSFAYMASDGTYTSNVISVTITVQIGDDDVESSDPDGESTTDEQPQPPAEEDTAPEDVVPDDAEQPEPTVVDDPGDDGATSSTSNMLFLPIIHQ